MPARPMTRFVSAFLAIAMLGLLSPAPRARAAEETVTCAVCGKRVKKDKAIRVIQNGRIYYVCSQECLEKLKKNEKKKK